MIPWELTESFYAESIFLICGFYFTLLTLIQRTHLELYSHYKAVLRLSAQLLYNIRRRWRLEDFYLIQFYRYIKARLDFWACFNIPIRFVDMTLYRGWQAESNHAPRLRASFYNSGTLFALHYVACDSPHDTVG